MTDGGDCNIPDAFLKKRGDNKRVCDGKGSIDVTYFMCYDPSKWK